MNMVTPNQIADIIRQLADSGINRVQLQALRDSGRFAALLREFMGDESAPAHPEPTSDKYMVTVDYNKPFADMIEAGKYDSKIGHFIVENFSVNKRESGEVGLYVVHFGRVRTREIRARLKKLGLRPAEPAELLALGAAHPDLQRKYSLVALGSGRRDEEGFMFLGEEGVKRVLNVVWIVPGGRWDDKHRFVAVSK